MLVPPPDSAAVLDFYKKEEARIQRMLDKVAKGEPASSQVTRRLYRDDSAFDDAISRMFAQLLDMVLDSPIVKDLLDGFLPRDAQVQVSRELISDIDPGCPSAIRQPHQLYAKLRRESGEVAWIGAHGAYWVLSPQLVREVLEDHHNFLQAPSSTQQRGIITLDGVRHEVVRSAVIPALKASTVDVEKYLKVAVHAALQDIGDLPQFDVIKKYSKPVPRNLFWKVFGLPKELREECAAFAETMMTHFGQPQARGAGPRAAFTDAMLRLAIGIAKAYVPTLVRSVFDLDYRSGTLIGEIARRTEVPLVPSERRTMHVFEALATLMQMVLASMSMQFHLGTAVRNLLSPDPRPGLQKLGLPWRQLVDIPNKQGGGFDLALSNALLESRRVDPPVGIIQRYAGPNGAKLGAIAFPKDCPVFAVVASAHTTASEEFPEPEQFHWDRKRVGNLALGTGLHACVGDALQNIVVPGALKSLMAAMPDLRLCDENSVPAWLDNLYFRTLQSLPVMRCP